MILLPRLDRGEVDLIAGQFNQELADPDEVLAIVDRLGLKPHWNQSGGAEVSKSQRDEFAEHVERIARDHGYPDYPDTLRQQGFDRSVCRLLDRTGFFLKSGGDTKRASVWAGLTCLDVSHVAVWRHSARGKGISRDRLQGGPRNFLRRLWLRNHALLLDDHQEDPWVLVDEMSEDSVVQVIERPSLASDRRLSSFMGLEWIKHRKKGVLMEPVMRIATRRIRATSQIRMLAALDDKQLGEVVTEAFEYAIRQCH